MMKSIVLILLIALPLRVFCFDIPQHVDFSPLHDAIRNALIKSKESNLFQAITNGSNSSLCHMPQSGIILTLSNHYTMELVVLQHKAMEIWHLRECLEMRFVTVCLDEKCLKLCQENSISNCVLLPLDIPQADFLQGAFRYLSYLKHMIMYEALKFVDEVFFFDADVLIFRNPWIDTRYRRNDDGSRIVGGSRVDMMWQREDGAGMGCLGNANGGQLYIRNSSRVMRYFQILNDFKPNILEGPLLDQTFLPIAVVGAQMDYCVLSPHLFTGHCLANRDIRLLNGNTPLNELVTYHVSCMTGLRLKRAALMRMYEAVKSKNEKNLLKDFV